MNMSEDAELISVDDVKIYPDTVKALIDEACTEMEIEDLRKEGQQIWKAVMRYVGKRLFNDKSILKSRILNVYKNNNIPTNNNSYDYALVDKICDYYLGLSDQYRKLPSIVAFSHFINISTNTIDRWAYTEPTSLSFKIWKKIQYFRHDTSKDRAYDSNHITGPIAFFNWEFGINALGETEKESICIDDIDEEALRLCEMEMKK